MPEYSSTTITPADSVKVPAMNGSTSGNFQLDALRNFILASKGQANGLASLGSDGKLPAAQLPDLADDVLVYANYATFPASGTAGKLYIAADTNKIYRWDDSLGTPAYVYLKVDWTDLTDGTVTVKKAECDASGNTITSTYETKADANDLKNAIDANSNRISNLEQEHGGYVPVNYRGTNDVPPNKAKYALVESIVGKSRAWNQMLGSANASSLVTFNNGTWTINETINATRTAIKTIPMISGHKYLFYYTLKSGTMTDILRLHSASTSYVDQLFGSSSRAWVYDCTTTANYDFNAVVGSSTTINITFGLICRDLTLILNDWASSDITTANIPNMVKQIPDLLKYDAYGTSIVDTTVEGVKSVGVNIFDEVTELGSIGADGSNTPSNDQIRSKNYMRVAPSTAYYVKVPSVGLQIFQYDINKNYISRDFYSSDSSFTTSANCAYIRFRTGSTLTTYQNDIQICLNSLPDAVKQAYHAYMTDTLTLPSSVTLRSAGAVADTDELNVEVNGVARRRQTTRIVRRTFGNKGWSYRNDGSVYAPYFWISVSTWGIAFTGYASDKQNIFTTEYINESREQLATKDMIFSTDGTVDVVSQLQFKDSRFDNLTDFVKHIKDLPVLYETLSPSVTLLDPIINNTILTEGGGTINTIQNNVYPDESPAPTIDNSMDVGYLAL